MLPVIKTFGLMATITKKCVSASASSSKLLGGCMGAPVQYKDSTKYTIHTKLLVSYTSGFGADAKSYFSASIQLTADVITANSAVAYFQRCN